MPATIKANTLALLGVSCAGVAANRIIASAASVRRAAFFRSARTLRHTQPAGSREAVRWFTEYLDEWPGDLRVRWLLNIASMTLGEHPGRFRRATGFRSRASAPRSTSAGSRTSPRNRPDLPRAGSRRACIFDDFNGDGRPDVFTSTFDVTHGASLHINRGDGTFEDRSEAFGLSEQVYALNVVRADYDNDGWPDVLLLRGAWEKPARLSLLHNKGARRSRM